MVYGDTTNLYARLGEAQPNLCFVGHVDVVPPGDEGEWKFPPFSPTFYEGALLGRGAIDMKGAIAAFFHAIWKFLEIFSMFSGSCSVLLTSDEEGSGENGIQKMIPWLEKNGQVATVFLIGEPTGTEVGEVVQVGRRGSITAKLTCFGKQGHIAYPHLADNPIPRILKVIEKLQTQNWDGEKSVIPFPASRLELTSIDAGNPVENIIPGKITARFGVRFNAMHSCKSLEAQMRKLCDPIAGVHELIVHQNGEAFITKETMLIEKIKQAMFSVTKKWPTETTRGGTTDGRFLHKVAPVIEVGLPEITMHQVNERVKISELELLSNIYYAILEKFLKL